MFSDIVGFLKIVKELEPKDVMQLLNNVFSKLDSTIEKHDAYKVRVHDIVKIERQKVLQLNRLDHFHFL